MSTNDDNNKTNDAFALIKRNLTAVIAIGHAVGFTGVFALRQYLKYKESLKPWTLFYWPGIRGRGEYMRLLFIETETSFIDHFAGETDMSKVMTFLNDILKFKHDVFAFPIIRHGFPSDPNSLVLSQSNAIVEYLAQKLDNGRLYPKSERQRTEARSLMNSVNDLFEDGLRSWYPVGLDLSFEEQKNQAQPYIKKYSETRLPKWLVFLDKVLKRNAERMLSEKTKKRFASYEDLVNEIEGFEQGHEIFFIGKSLSYVDLCIFHVLDGNKHSCPTAFMLDYEEQKGSSSSKVSSARFPLLELFYDQIQNMPRIKAWIADPARPPLTNEAPCC